jgi:hypothetical protein
MRPRGSSDPAAGFGEVRPEIEALIKRLRARVAPACLLAASVFSCSSCGGPGGEGAGAPDFTLVNRTGATLKAVYVSPHDSEGWEENVLGGDEMFSGESVGIGFDPRADAAAWDLRVEAAGGQSAEWKNLDLRRISRITLRFRNGVAVAEAE